ncbi:MAG: PEGA domain-containing protein [Patescibacteria group bacterium]
MTKRTRRVIMLTAFFVFIIFAPAILCYAWGYSFDWENKRIVLTGGLYLKSIPKDAQIYLNDKPKQKSPAFIKRLAPKEYQIKLVKDGYYPWQKNLKVESKLVTEARNILLIPLNPKIQVVEQNLAADFSLEKFLGLVKPTNVFYIQKPSNILYKTDQNNSFQEQITFIPLTQNQEYQVFNSLNDQVVLLTQDRQFFLLNWITREFELIGKNIQGFQFSDDNKKLLYYTPNELWVYYLAGTPEQPTKNAGNKELITRISQPIETAIWYGQTNQHIILKIGQDIKIIELDDRDQRNAVDFLKSDFQEISYSPKDKKIYLIKDNQLLGVSLE